MMHCETQTQDGGRIACQRTALPVGWPRGLRANHAQMNTIPLPTICCQNDVKPDHPSLSPSAKTQKVVEGQAPCCAL